MAFLGTPVRDYRYGLMRDLMDREGYDALAFTTGDFFQFVTNFQTDVQPWERPIVCVVPRNGEPFAVLNELSTNHWRFTAEGQRLWVTDATSMPSIRGSARACRLPPNGPISSRAAEGSRTGT